MSFKKFKTYLEESLSNPRLIKSDWELDNKFPPHNPEILKWASTDSEDAFTSILDNPKDVRRDRLSKKLLNNSVDYYLSNPIEYSLNEYRFRSDSFCLNIDGNLFLGCSDTFGVGHHLEHTWPYILTQLRFPNYKIYNLGVPGSGSDTNFRHLALLKNSIKIKNIFHWLPIRSRFEYFIDSPEPYSFSQFNLVVPQWETSNEIFSNFYIKNGLSTSVTRNLNILKNISAIKEISNEIKIPYYISNFDGCGAGHESQHLNEVLNYLDKNNIPRTLLARDFSHSPIIDVAKTVANFLFLIDSYKKII